MMILGIKIEFILFALILLGIILSHAKAIYISVLGLLSILMYKLLFVKDFSLYLHFFGNGTTTSQGEWRILLNLLGLLLGFAILSKHFEESNISNSLTKYLPSNWKGCFLLLSGICILSSFLDNIAAAMIGGAIAHTLFKGKVHVGFVAAIIAASNAGGAGSVIGDTTTTMMWISGVGATKVLLAFIGSFSSLLFFGFFASMQQHRLQPIIKYSYENESERKTDIWKLVIVLQILILTILTNWLVNFPALGVWIGIFIGAIYRKTPWRESINALPGSVFLLCLVFSASLMPVNELPSASWVTAFVLGIVSAFFDNIPLTKLCLEQGGYDWGILAYSVGFGGSMVWFGSSAGVALSGMYPESKSFITYVRSGWHVIVSYFIGFFVMLAIAGWNP